MQMSLVVAQEQTISLVGGLTESIFPRVEQWLQLSSDHAESLKYIAARKNMNRYRSVVDFLFCEIFLRFRSRCFAYYDERGKKLAEIITESERQEFENVLMTALQGAYNAFREKRRLSWATFRREVLGIAA